MFREPFSKQISAQIPRLRRYARSLTQDLEQADDLVQDCLERAWSRRIQWKEGTDLRAWLFTIMHNQFVNIVRKEQRRAQSSGLEDDVDTKLDRTPSIMILKDLERGLAELPLEQKEVLMLVCLEELSYQQVAEILEIPIGTVMSRLHRARERMRDWMKAEPGPNLRRVK